MASARCPVCQFALVCKRHRRRSGYPCKLANLLPDVRAHMRTRAGLYSNTWYVFYCRMHSTAHVYPSRSTLSSGPRTLHTTHNNTPASSPPPPPCPPCQPRRPRLPRRLCTPRRPTGATCPALPRQRGSARVALQSALRVFTPLGQGGCVAEQQHERAHRPPQHVRCLPAAGREGRLLLKVSATWGSARC